jgi:hypothetical protein
MASTFFLGMLIASACFYIPALLGFFTPMFYLHFILGIPTLFTDLLISLGAYFNNALGLPDAILSSSTFLDVFPKGWSDFL